MSKPKISELPIEIQVAIINAARDVSVAKITQKKAAFDGYVQPYYWFDRAMDEVFEAYHKHNSEPKKW
ncbi:hypothetical protein PUG46_19450 [Erwiniaceae bacterium L1_55_4]|nr:hypothetical protein [Erwiniaceae bacterium L1_55_4]